MLRRILTMSLFLTLLSCGSSDDTAATFTYDGAVGALNNASTAMTSAGDSISSESLTSLTAKLRKNAMVITESTSDRLSYCSQYGRAWNSTGNTAANPGDTDYALHMIECTARIDESTETPVGFLGQMAMIACMLTDAGVDLDVEATQTFSNISINPSAGSARCKALSNTDLENEDEDYAFNVDVVVAPTGWDRSVALSIGSDPFFKFFVSETSSALAIKSQEFTSGNADGSIELTLDRTSGSLLFEMISTRNPGHARIKLDGNISASWNFTAVTNVSGIKTICFTDGCDSDGVSGSYEGATLNGTLDDLEFESIQVSGLTCNLGADGGCTAATGTNCTSGCVNYGDPVDNVFIDDESFEVSVIDVVSGPICFTSVTNTLAPTRAASLAACSL